MRAGCDMAAQRREARAQAARLGCCAEKRSTAQRMRSGEEGRVRLPLLFHSRRALHKRYHEAMSAAAPRRRRRLALAAALCVSSAAASTGPTRAGPPVVNVPSTAPRVPRHNLQPYVVAVTTVNGDSYVDGGGAYTSGATLYVFVEFSERVLVTGTPALQLCTGAHFEAGAVNVSAAFLGGGASLSKGFWRNDAPSPLLSGLPPLCRAGAQRPSSPTPYAYNASRPWGPAYCVPGAAPEQRVEERMARSLAFAFDVLPGHRTPQLDVTGAAALTLPAGAAVVSEDTGFAALSALPTPGIAARVRALLYLLHVFVSHVISVNRACWARGAACRHRRGLWLERHS